jgi:hypothetical protein
MRALACFCFRQLLGKAAEKYAGPVVGKLAVDALGTGWDKLTNHLTDHSEALPKALASANDRTWDALRYALSDGKWDTVKGLFKSGDHKGITEKIRLLLQGEDDDFRQLCLTELVAARSAGRLSVSEPTLAEVIGGAAQFNRYAPEKLHRAAQQFVALHVADALKKARYENLAELAQLSPDGGLPLIVLTFTFFFRAELREKPKLKDELEFDILENLSAGQLTILNLLSEQSEQLGRVEGKVDAGFEDLAAGQNSALAMLDNQGDALARIEDVGREGRDKASEIHDHVKRLHQEIQALRLAHDMAQNAVKPTHSLSIRSDQERKLVGDLLARYRRLPAEAKKYAAKLANGLGFLELGVGEPTVAQGLFAAAAANSPDAHAKAQAEHNRYCAALEARRFEDALSALLAAAKLDPHHFAPFPLERYRPEAILGAGGFGTAFLCHDVNWNIKVVVKILHAGELQQSTGDVLREAKLLRDLRHPSIISVRDFGYADQGAQARPYLVMEYFPGDTLHALVERGGPLPAKDWMAIARAIGAAMCAAHAQGIFHRDLKPENVLVRKVGAQWEVRIIDFGLAFKRQTLDATKLGSSLLGQSIAGTVTFAPPEQMGRGPRDVRVGPYSDVFSFGKLSCFALFKTTEPKGRHWETVGKELQKLLEDCTDEDVQYRPRDFQAVLQRLENQDLKEKRANEEERQKLARLQADGEKKLAGLLMDIYQRTNGKPDAADKAAVKALADEHQLPRDAMQRVKSEVQEKYRDRRRAATEREHQEELARSEQVRKQLGPELFAQLDTNGDGIIQPEELENFLRRQKEKEAQHQQELDRLQAEARFRELEARKQQEIEETYLRQTREREEHQAELNRQVEEAQEQAEERRRQSDRANRQGGGHQGELKVAPEVLQSAASGMLICGVLNLLTNGLMILMDLYLVKPNLQPGQRDSMGDFMWMFSTMAIASGISIVAAISMGKLLSYWLGILGSITIMWGGLGCCWAGIPIGIWCLIVLLRRDVREAFDS